MNEFWRLNNRFLRWLIVGIMSFLYQSSLFCWSLNVEGIALLRFRERILNDPYGALSTWNGDIGEDDPCSWFGVECADKNVVSLNLKDLCLEGTLAPELAHLDHLKSIILRGNHFSGIIPGEISELRELEVLDLGYNNLSGPLPPLSGTKLSILLLDNNGLFCNLYPEIEEILILSEVQVDETHSTWVQRSPCCSIAESENLRHERKMQETKTGSPPPGQAPKDPRFSPPPPTPPPPIIPLLSPPPMVPSKSEPPTLHPESRTTSKSSKSHNLKLIVILPIVGGFLILTSVIGIILYRRKKLAIVGPWATGLSAQLRKAFLTDVPKLKRSDIKNACEDFSNVVGSSSLGTVYKGTLSNGAEIAVISLAVTSTKDWSQNLQVQFWEKINTLSKMNHKNFLNLLGCCEEDEPFTRMMVFEYAPNGTLFEHLHIREAEHLDWKMRLRIAMGMAYCLEHMHHLNPPVAHKNLSSSSVVLAEDYSAKISDFNFSNEMSQPTEPQSIDMRILVTSSSGLEEDVFSFGVVLLELVTGRVFSSYSNGSFDDSEVLDYLSGKKPLQELVDPMLISYDVEQLLRIGEVIKCCVHADLQRRITIREVAARLREITAINPDAAQPDLSPVWWAELEGHSPPGSS